MAKQSETNGSLDASEQLANVNVVYLNRAQVAVYNMGARTTTVEAGRGTGKTDGLLSPYMVRATQSMPRGTGIFLGNSIKQLFTKTVPNTITAIERITGLREGVHFFRGHAPAKCNFQEPLVKPKIWENCIHFWNGYTWYMISTATRAAANGMNVCSIAGDEARFMPEATIKSEILPTLRGINTTHPGFDETKNPMFKSLFLVSDKALTRRQEWVSRRRDEQTFGINKKIVELINEANRYPEIVQSPKFQRALTKLRCQANAFFSFSTIENIDILGEQFIRKMEEELTPTMFDISIRNLEKERISDGYYSNLNIDDIHGYTCSDEDQIEAAQKFNHKVQTNIYSGGRTLRVETEQVDLNALSKNITCELDTDIIDYEPLRIAIDYNANINCLAVGQTPSRRNNNMVRVLKSFAWTKKSRIEGLMEEFCKYYAPHKAYCKDVIFYIDATAKQGGSYASEKSDETKFFNVAMSVMKNHGWHVDLVDMGTPMRHNTKYEYLNNCLAGKAKPIIRINTDNNPYLIASMENARVVEGRGGFMKDKSQEKRRVSVACEDPEAELAERTDMSDAFDTLIIGVGKFGAGRTCGAALPSCM